MRKQTQNRAAKTTRELLSEFDGRQSRSRSEARAAIFSRYSSLFAFCAERGLDYPATRRLLNGETLGYGMKAKHIANALGIQLEDYPDDFTPQSLCKIWPDNCGLLSKAIQKLDSLGVPILGIDNRNLTQPVISIGDLVPFTSSLQASRMWSVVEDGKTESGYCCQWEGCLLRWVSKQ